MKKEEILLLETNIDDMAPCMYEYVMGKLFDRGALDVWITPIIMKKSRPAQTLSVLVKRVCFEDILNILFSETTTIGIRYRVVQRIELDKKNIERKRNGQVVRLKESYFKGALKNISPEYDDCVKIAMKENKPLKEIYNLYPDMDYREKK